MTLFDDLTQAAAWPALAALHGEPVTVIDVDGTERPVTAVVTRNPPAPIAEVPGDLALASKLTIRFENHPTRGVASGTFDSTMSVVLPRRAGETPTRMRLAELLGDKGGITRIAVV
jgi:hypothetical protein